MVDKSEAEAVDLVLKLQEKLVSGFPSVPPSYPNNNHHPWSLCRGARKKKGGDQHKVACSI